VTATGAKASWGLAEGEELAPGRTVLAPLGGGSAYEVLLVWDERFYALMVAKVLRPDRAEDPHDLRDLAREAEALDRLRHPMLVRGFDAQLGGHRPHLLIEHLEGPSLHSLLRRHAVLPPEQLLPLAAHMAGALHYMGGAGWVHLDVKPDNIIMGVPPRLVDLSVARPVERAARLRAPVGTDGYMAPEQCAPDGRIGPATDIWGLGATLFHALTGGRPFPRPKAAGRSDDPAVRFPQLHADPAPLPRKTSPALAGLLERMLAKDPDDRPEVPAIVAALEPEIARLPRRLVLSKRGARFR
jgi:eukaryotic-like serine/threonine-protein kinase